MNKPANILPNNAPRASGAICVGVTKKGAPCSWRALEAGAFCLLHDPAKTEERAAMLSARGKAGKQRQMSNQAAIVAAVQLDTHIKIREAIEEALLGVRSSSADPIARANATARLCGVALEILKTRDLEGRLNELAALVEQMKGKEQ